MAPVTDSFLRLWDGIRDPTLGCNLDCGWAMISAEYRYAITASNHLILHVRDIDQHRETYNRKRRDGFQAIADAVKASVPGLPLARAGWTGEDMKKFAPLCKTNEDLLS